jgi:hypothetical protein
MATRTNPKTLGLRQVCSISARISAISGANASASSSSSR